MKRSKSSFNHSAVNFYPIGMQLMPKCSQFNAQSCDMRRYALYRVPVLVFSEMLGHREYRGTGAKKRSDVWFEGLESREGKDRPTTAKSILLFVQCSHIMLRLFSLIKKIYIYSDSHHLTVSLCLSVCVCVCVYLSPRVFPIFTPIM